MPIHELPKPSMVLVADSAARMLDELAGPKNEQGIRDKRDISLAEVPPEYRELVRVAAAGAERVAVDVLERSLSDAVRRLKRADRRWLGIYEGDGIIQPREQTAAAKKNPVVTPMMRLIQEKMGGALTAKDALAAAEKRLAAAERLRTTAEQEREIRTALTEMIRCVSGEALGRVPPFAALEKRAPGVYEELSGPYQALRQAIENNRLLPQRLWTQADIDYNIERATSRLRFELGQADLNQLSFEERDRIGRDHRGRVSRTRDIKPISDQEAASRRQSATNRVAEARRQLIRVLEANREHLVAGESVSPEVKAQRIDDARREVEAARAQLDAMQQWSGTSDPGF